LMASRVWWCQTFYFLSAWWMYASHSFRYMVCTCCILNSLCDVWICIISPQNAVWSLHQRWLCSYSLNLPIAAGARWVIVYYMRMPQHNRLLGSIAWKLSVFSFQFCNSRCQGLTLTPTGIIFWLACLIDIITGRRKRKNWPLCCELNSSLLMMQILMPSPPNHEGPW
jgi:hypothetical protein